MDTLPLPVHRLTPRATSELREGCRPAPVLLPAFVILLGLLLRISLLGVDVRFHPDEALYASQARMVAQADDLLLRQTDLDKPPLTLYVTALSFRALGVSEFSARLPNVLFSSLSIAALYGLARTMYGGWRVALLTALLLALSPYELAFAATAFADVQATFWVLVAAWCAARDRWGWAGVAAGLVFGAKPNALAFLPLIVVFGMVRQAAAAWGWRDVARRIWALAWPLALVVACIVLWDLARAPRSFLALGAARNNPGRFIRSDEVWPRLVAWGGWLRWIVGSRILGAALLGAVGLWLAGTWRRRDRLLLADRWIAIALAALMTALWFIAFNTYDRYVHTLVPFALLLAVRALCGLPRLRRSRHYGNVLAALIVVMMLPSTLTALRGAASLGGDQGRHAGIDGLGVFVNDKLGGEILYDHWLGWELAYYLGAASRVEVLYAPSPEELADDARAQSGSSFFAAPSAAHAAPWLAELTRAHVPAAAVYWDAAHGFVVYRLDPPVAASPRWH